MDLLAVSFPRPQNFGHIFWEHLLRTDVGVAEAEAEVLQSVLANVVGPTTGVVVYPHGFEPVSIAYVEESLHTHQPVAAIAGQ